MTSRKLTTIFACDVVGYSTLMSNDEEGTLDSLNSCREIIDKQIDKHDGRIFNTAGDAVLAEFGSPVEGVRCAVSIQEDLRIRNADLATDKQMWVRIGINVGDVMIEGENLFGDGVNVAARLEGLAEKGGICISGSTFNLTKNKLSIDFEDIGSQSVKNIPEPVQAFKLVPGESTVSNSTVNFNKNWLVGSGAAAVVVIALGLWYFIPFTSNPYDGQWRLTFLTSSGCGRLDSRVPISYTMNVKDGNVNEPSYRTPKTGTISKDGLFNIRSVRRDSGALVEIQKGRIEGSKGTGSFVGSNLNCGGDVLIERLN